MVYPVSALPTVFVSADDEIVNAGATSGHVIVNLYTPPEGAPADPAIQLMPEVSSGDIEYRFSGALNLVTVAPKSRDEYIEFPIVAEIYLPS